MFLKLLSCRVCVLTISISISFFRYLNILFEHRLEFNCSKYLSFSEPDWPTQLFNLTLLAKYHDLNRVVKSNTDLKISNWCLLTSTDPRLRPLVIVSSVSRYFPIICVFGLFTTNLEDLRHVRGTIKRESKYEMLQVGV